MNPPIPAASSGHDGAVPYLTPEVPRWVPKDETAIEAAADGGLLVESHYLDLKAAIPDGSAKNRELARDLASFAIDGGALLVGLAERDDGPPELAPVELAGLAERVEQVARQIPDPPIPVTCTPIPASSAPGRGYLLIEIPAPGIAPHMVDGVTWVAETRPRSGSATRKCCGSTKTGHAPRTW